MAVRELDGPNAKAVVEKVIAALEQGGSRGFDRTTRAPVVALKPDLDGLIKVSEKMSAAMRGQVEVCKQERAKALRAVNDCNVKKGGLETELEGTKASIAREQSNANENWSKIQRIQGQIRDNDKKTAQLRQDEARAMGMTFGRPGGGMQAFARGMLEHCQREQGVQSAALNRAQNDLASTKARQSTLEALVSSLGSKRAATEREIGDLNASIAALDNRSQAYARKMEEFDQAVLYYRQLSDAIENLQTNLAQRMVARLLEKKELVRLTADGDGAGQRVTSTLKEMLILLAGEYDLYVRNGLPQISGIPPLLSRM